MSYDPPWLPPWQQGRGFTVPGIENVPDLHGDLHDPQLVVFFGGNQFMVTHALMRAFQQQHPTVERVYFQTLPPGVMVEQIEQGALVIGNLRVTVRPDVLTAGQGRIRDLQAQRGWFDRALDYTSNKLAIMVPEGNPAGVGGLADLGRDAVRVAMPDPKTEGIAEKIKQAYRKAGGEALIEQIMETKRAAGTTRLTTIHHRQTPLWLLWGEADAGPVWQTEVFFQQSLGHPLDGVTIPEAHNVSATYSAGRFKDAAHHEAADAFLDFLVSDAGQAIYGQHGFLPAAGE